MNALILSCGTGGGHNAAGRAIKEELESRGHQVTMMDPYDLKNPRLSGAIGNFYIRMVQKAPGLFGFIYLLGNLYRNLPIHSPVYWANAKMAEKMENFLNNHSFDVIFMSHLYPGEILTKLKKQGVRVPKTIFIATDYTCIPFTEEIDCDCYIIPAEDLKEEYVARGINPDKILPISIPVRRAFRENVSRETAIEQLRLQQEKRYLLLAGGSVGAGNLQKTMHVLQQYLKTHGDAILIVICGNNEKLYEKLQRQYNNDPQVILLQKTSHMAAYMKVSDVVISKPGGLSSTEAAVVGVPLIHISPIPGCETINMEYFSERNMSIAVNKPGKQLLQALEKCRKEKAVTEMIENQKRYIDAEAAGKICDFAES